MSIIWQSTDFELVEIYDYADDPAPRVRFRWRTAQYGTGRCGCRRQLPRVSLTTEIEEEDLIRLVRAILKYYLYKYARLVVKRRMRKKVQRDIEREINRDLAFLQRWENDLLCPVDSALLDYGTESTRFE